LFWYPPKTLPLVVLPPSRGIMFRRTPPPDTSALAPLVV
jgi:hypothetical protein